MRSPVLLLLSCLVLAVAAPVSGQITGTVRDQLGQPVSAAFVELLAGDSAVSRGETDGRGYFDLVPHPQATSVRASGLGVQSAVYPIGDLMSPLEIVLAPQAFQLTGLRVTAAERSCPQTNDPDAQLALIQILAEGADILNDQSSWASPIEELRTGRGLLREDIPMELQDVGFGQMGGGGVALRLWMSSVRRGEPFAQRRRAGDTGGDGMAWRLGGFHGSAAPALATPGLLDDAQVERLNEGGYLACVAQEDADLLATFSTEHGRLREVSWRIRTADLEELKGGHLYLPENGRLFPTRSYVWVREADGRARTDLVVFGPWFVGSGDEVRRSIREYVESRGTRD